MMDWIKALRGFSQEQISNACDEWVKRSKWRPAPHDIRDLIERIRQSGGVGAQKGDRSELSRDELHILDTKVLPMARRWMQNPDLREHAENTLAYWGEQ